MKLVLKLSESGRKRKRSENGVVGWWWRLCSGESSRLHRRKTEWPQLKARKPQTMTRKEVTRTTTEMSSEAHRDESNGEMNHNNWCSCQPIQWFIAQFARHNFKPHKTISLLFSDLLLTLCVCLMSVMSIKPLTRFSLQFTFSFNSSLHRNRWQQMKHNDPLLGDPNKVMVVETTLRNF